MAEDLGRYRQQEPIRARLAGPCERAAKWVRRRPKTAIAFGASGLALVALVLGILLYRDLLYQQREIESSNRQFDYVLAMREAQHAYENGFFERAPEILARLHPSPGQIDLRNFAWYYLWRLRPREPQCFAGHRGWVNGLAFSPDGQLVASGGGDSIVRVWNLATGQFQDCIGHKDVIAELAFAPDGQTLASSSWDKTIKLWDVSTRKSGGRYTDIQNQ